MEVPCDLKNLNYLHMKPLAKNFINYLHVYSGVSFDPALSRVRSITR